MKSWNRINQRWNNCLNTQVGTWSAISFCAESNSKLHVGTTEANKFSLTCLTTKEANSGFVFISVFNFFIMGCFGFNSNLGCKRLNSMSSVNWWAWVFIIWRATPISSTVTTHGCVSSLFVSFTLAALLFNCSCVQLSRLSTSLCFKKFSSSKEIQRSMN